MMSVTTTSIAAQRQSPATRNGFRSESVWPNPFGTRDAMAGVLRGQPILLLAMSGLFA
jgi:hypothetical protein